MVQIEDGQIIRFNLPKTGTLSDGRTVSGYHLLDKDVLKAEGWLTLEDARPIYDENTQYIVDDGYEVLEDKVVKKYRVEDIPEPEIVDEHIDEEKIAMAEAIIDLNNRISTLEGGE